MKQDQARDVFKEIGSGLSLKNADDDEIFRVFCAFSQWNHHMTQERTKHIMKHMDEEGAFSAYESADEASNYIFQGAFIDVLARKYSGLDDYAEYDSESWIDNAAEPVATDIIKRMENLIIRSGAPSFKEKLAFYKKIDFDKYEAEVSATLKRSLSDMTDAVEQKFGVSAEASMS